MNKIGIVTGGGDCPGLNAVIRAVAKAASQRGWECIGVLGGYEGLLEPAQTRLTFQNSRAKSISGTFNDADYSSCSTHDSCQQSIVLETACGRRSCMFRWS